jgi:hypothetical protein
MFPTMYYDLSTSNTPDVKVVLDITRRIKFKDIIMANAVFYDYYIVQNGETPEMLSDRFYSSPFYHWILLIANDIVDVKSEWPMDENIFDKYIGDKYGITHINDIHHYINDNGLIVDAGAPTSSSVSNYDYEIFLNNQKRILKIVKPEMIDTILDQFEAAIQA